MYWLATFSPRSRRRRDSRFFRENRFPIAFHAHDCPPFLDRFVPRLVKPAYIRIAIVSPFAFGIVVMDERHEPSAGACCCPFQHLLVAIGVADSKNRPPTNELLNAYSFAIVVIDKIHFW